MAVAAMLLALGGGVSLAADGGEDRDRESDEAFRQSLAEQAKRLPRSKAELPQRSSRAVREQSRRAYRGHHSAKQSRSLLRRTTPHLASPESDVPPASRVSGVLSPGAARIEDEDGKPLGTVVASQPLAVPSGRGGRLQLADTRWREPDEAEGRIEIRRAALPVSVGHRAADPLQVGPLRIGVAPAGDAARTSIADVGDQVVTYPNAGPDLDVFVRSTTVGVQVGWQLRSPAAPETIELDVDLPTGGKLVQLEGDGVSVVGRDGTQLGGLSPVAAVDADGVSVPARLDVVGDDRLRLLIDHRDGDYRYGIVADPIIFGNWNSGETKTFNFWQEQWSRSNVGFGLVKRPAAPGTTPTNQDNLAGLWIIGSGGSSTVVQDYAMFYAVGPGDTSASPSARAWIWRMDAAGLNYTLLGGNGWQDPGPAIGMQMPNGAWDTRAHWRYVLPNGTPGGIEQAENGTPSIFMAANTFNVHQRHYLGANSADASGNATPDNRVGISMVDWGYQGSGARPTTSLQTTWTALYVNDATDPAFTTAVQSTPWLDQTAGTVQVGGDDRGTGVYQARLETTAGAALGNPATADCPTSGRELCPFTTTLNVPVDGAPTGKTTQRVRIYDGGTRSATQSITLRVDADKPAVERDPGQVTNGNPNPVLPDSSDVNRRTINVKATDGTSGVKTVTAKVDGQAVAVPQPSPCTLDDCAKTFVAKVPAAALSTGLHRVEVTVADQVASSDPAVIARHTATTTLEVYVIQEDQGPAREVEPGLGFEDWNTYDTTPTGAGSNHRVNLATGNSVWSVTPVQNPGVGLNTVLRLTYNSHEPASVLPGLLGANGVFGYGAAGRGFSVQLGSITRLNEPLEINGIGGAPLLLSQSADDATRIVLTDGDGTRHVFPRDTGKPGVRFSHPPGVYLQLRRFTSDANSPRFWAATRPDGTTFFFYRDGRASEVEDRHHNVLRLIYEPRPTSLPSALRPGCGQTLVCTQRVKEIVDAAAIDATGLVGGPTAESRKWILSYDDQNDEPYRLIKVEDRKRIGGERRITRLGYDTAGNRLTSLTVADNPSSNGPKRGWTFGYKDSSSYLERVTDPRGNDTTISYSAPRASALPLLDPLLQPLLGWVGLVQDFRTVTSVEDRSSDRQLPTEQRRITTYRLDDPRTENVGGQNVTRRTAWVRNARKVVDKVTVDGSGRMIEMVQGANDPTTTDELTEDGSRTTLQGWTDQNEVAFSTIGAGVAPVTTEYAWDETRNLGQLLSETEHAGVAGATGGERRSRSWTYRTHAGTVLGEGDAGGSFVYDTTSETDRRGKTTTYGYAAASDNGDVISITRPENGFEQFEYTPRGLVKKHVTTVWSGTKPTFNSTEQNTVEESWDEFDANGDPREHRDEEDKSWTTRRDEVGNTISLADPRATQRAWADPAAPPEQAAGGSTDPVAAIGGTPRDDARGTGPAYMARWTYDALDRQVVAVVPKRSTATEKDEHGDDKPVADRFRVTATTFDLNDNPTRRRDGEGHVSESTYTKTDRVEEERSEAVAHRSATEPDDSDDLEAPAREVTRYRYDPVDNPIVRADPLGGLDQPGHRTRWLYNAFDEPTVQSRDSAQDLDRSATATYKKVTTSRAYDVRGNVVAEADANTNGELDLQQAAAKAKVSAAQRWLYVYDAFDRVVDATENPVIDTGEQSDTVGLNTHYEYDEEDHLRAKTTPAGRRTEYRYDDAGRLTRRIDPFSAPGQGTLTAETSYDRRADGEVYAITSPRGNDGAGANGFKTRLSYWRTGELKARGLPRRDDQYGPEWKVQYQINAVGDPETITDARGKTFTNEFLDTGELSGSKRPSWWIYDEQDGRIRERTDDDPRPKAQTADQLPDDSVGGDFGSVEPQSLPDVVPAAGDTGFYYDDELRLTRVTSQGDAAGDHVSQDFLYDGVGRLVERKIPFDAGSTISLRSQYDRNGNLAATIDGRNQITVHRYDAFDRPSSTTAPPNCAPTPAPCVRPTSSSDRDPNGNVWREVTPAKDDGFNVDGDGTTGKTTRTFDAVDRVRVTVDPANARTEQAYDRDGLVSTLWRPQAFLAGHAKDDYRTRYEHDGAGRVTKETSTVTQPGGSTAENVVTDTTYDRNGNVTKVVAPEAGAAPGATPKRRVQEREYDGRDLPWVQTIGVYDSDPQQNEARTTITEFDGNGWLRRTIRPAGVKRENGRFQERVSDPQTDLDASPDSGEIGRNAEVLRYTNDGLLEVRHLPWGNGDGEVGDNDRKRWRQRFEYTQRGLLRRVTGIYDDGNGSGNPDHDTTVTNNAAGWVKQTVSQDIGGTGSSEAVTMNYGYDEQGNQTSWGSGTRTVTRKFHPSGLLAKRCGTRRFGSGANETVEEQVYSYRYDQSGGLRRLVDWSHGTIDDPNAARCAEADMSEGPEDPNIGPRTTAITRDRAGRPLRVNETWSAGKDTVYDYVDETPNLIDSVKTDGRLSGLSYLGGTRTRYGYDELDRNTKVSVWTDSADTGPADRETGLRWWPSGDRKQTIKAKTSGGQSTSEKRYYDTAGLITRRDVSAADGNDDRHTSYSYDVNGNRTHDERGTNTYNARDQLTKWVRDRKGSGAPTEKDPAKQIDYTVDGSGRQTRVVQEIKIDEAGDSYGTITTQVETDNDYFGDRITRARQTISVTDVEGGTAPGPKHQTDCFDYNKMGSQIVQIRKSQADQTCPGTIAAGGGWRTETQNTYDTFERLVASRKREHGDAQGTDEGTLPKNQAYCYDALDRRDKRLTGLATTEEPDDGEEQVSAFQKARRACTLSPSSQPEGLKTYDYSYLGLSKQLTREAKPDSRVQTYEYTASGERLGRLKRVGTGSPEWRSYETDAQGSVVGLEDPASGRVVTDDRYDTDPYGELVKPEEALDTEAEANPFRFQGFYRDENTGLYDMQARTYDPSQGRFLQQDRFADPSADLYLAADPFTSSRYAFTAANPATRAEYDGHVRNCDGDSACIEQQRLANYNQGRRSGGGTAPASTVNQERAVLAVVAISGIGQRILPPPPPPATAAATTASGQPNCGDLGPFNRESCRSGPSPASKGLKWLGNALDDGAEATAGAAAGGVGALSCTLTGQAFTSGGCDPSATEAAVKGGLMGIYGFLKPDASDGIVGALTSVFKPAKAGAFLVKHMPDAERFVKKALGLCRSFSGDTLVLMGDGSLKPIRQIRAGDIVIATDPRTGKRSKRRVTGIGAHVDRLYRLDIAGETLRSTEDHPFWNATDHAWQDAADLDASDVVLTADGRLVPVGGGLRPLSGQDDVAYNLAVEGVHTYHVGRASILVHNSGACSNAPKPGAGAPRSTRFVTTSRGTTFDIPQGWVAREADNGKGVVYQRPGATGNADMIRIMEPTARYPKGYYRYYNEHGQPLNAAGKPGSKADTHFPEDYAGPMAGWPR
ncbi:RHS repeat-associated core domain-containing protein [Patulibacter defluvii]|uniref:RHS repeat-associated core domain-containing protein n=1 Tax=Patulibacter defluvii TaxID=3095358 RepID=UPI002A76410C|nr:RHS repeat-associated core domain-containing protein [Patulibacter sp. DM4]